MQEPVHFSNTLLIARLRHIRRHAHNPTRNETALEVNALKRGRETPQA